MSVTVRVAGGAGELVALEGEVIAAVFARAFAPGAPVKMEALLGEDSLPVEGKTIGSRRREDGRFDVRLRAINLRRETREALARALAA